MNDEPDTLENALQESLSQSQGEMNLTEQAGDASALSGEHSDKSPADLSKMLQDAQAMIGRQSAEVGEMRRFTEQLMQRENERLETPVEHPSDEVEWDDSNPQESLKKLVDSTLSHKLKGIEQQLSKVTQYTATQELSAKHEDWQTIVNGEQFKTFATSTPIRQELYQRASQGDVAAAQELIGTYKELNAGTGQTQTGQPSAVQHASLESGNTTMTRAASGKPVLRRADIMRLQVENPKRYKEWLPEIRQAYLDKRVK